MQYQLFFYNCIGRFLHIFDCMLLANAVLQIALLFLMDFHKKLTIKALFSLMLSQHISCMNFDLKTAQFQPSFRLLLNHFQSSICFTSIIAQFLIIAPACLIFSQSLSSQFYYTYMSHLLKSALLCLLNMPRLSPGFQSFEEKTVKSHGQMHLDRPPHNCHIPMYITVADYAADK